MKTHLAVYPDHTSGPVVQTLCGRVLDSKFVTSGDRPADCAKCIAQDKDRKWRAKILADARKSE